MFSEITATLDLDRLRHNAGVLRGCCRPGTRMCAALKANAYGHGLREVAPALFAAGVEAAAVATLDEAIALRELQRTWPILVFGSVLTFDAPRRNEVRQRAAALVEHGLIATVSSPDGLDELSAAATAHDRTAAVHLKIDTGMGRQGATPARVDGLLAAVRDRPGLRVTGIYSHFATADLGLHDLVESQLAGFRGVLAALGPMLPAGTTRHLANSAATLTLPAAHFDQVRPGLALYGYAPSPAIAERFDLRPTMRVESRITLVKTLPAGHCVGYGCEFRTPRETRLGIVPAGYADGFVRAISLLGRPARLPGAPVVGTAAGDAPIIGRVSMDQLAVDLTDLPTTVGAGSPVTLIDSDPARPNSVATWAERLDTIPYEVVCLLGPRMTRMVRSGSAGSSSSGA